MNQPPADRGKRLPSGKRTLRNISAGFGLLLLLVILAYALRAPLLTGVADYLIVNDQPRTADIIFLLNGDYNTRPFRASELYRQGLAPVIVIARMENSPAVDLGLLQNSTDIAVGVMEKQGVPADKILVLPFPGGVTSTFDEAETLKQYIGTHPIHRVLLVTSAFHTRRARWIFEKTLAGFSVTLDMVAVPYSDFDQSNWWTNEDGLITLNNEYIKLVYYASRIVNDKLTPLAHQTSLGIVPTLMNSSLTPLPNASIMLSDVALRPVSGLELGV